MVIKRLFPRVCIHCQKTLIGREESGDRVWWNPCNCRNIPGPVDYPRLLSKDMIEPVKVFCQDCKNVRSSSDCFGGVGCWCAVAGTKQKDDFPTHIRFVAFTIEEKNKDNHCQDYKKAKWWQKIWANTNG